MLHHFDYLPQSLPGVGKPVQHFLLARNTVREDARIFTARTTASWITFKLRSSPVNGVGPKGSAGDLVSELSADPVSRLHCHSEDIPSPHNACAGYQQKGAEHIVLEIENKMGVLDWAAAEVQAAAAAIYRRLCCGRQRQ